MQENDFRSSALGVFCCEHVFRQERPILFVVHDQDGDWQFLCGQSGHSAAQGHLVHLGHFLDSDPTLHELADLKPGWEAERSEASGLWLRTKSTADDT